MGDSCVGMRGIVLTGPRTDTVSGLRISVVDALTVHAPERFSMQPCDPPFPDRSQGVDDPPFSRIAITPWEGCY